MIVIKWKICFPFSWALSKIENVLGFKMKEIEIFMNDALKL